MQIVSGSELRQRVITGSIGAVAFILVLRLGGTFGAALIAVLISLGMLYEFTQITFQLSDKKQKTVVLLGTAWLCAFINFLTPRSEYEILLLVFLGFFSYFLFTAERHKELPNGLTDHYREFVFSVFGFIYLVFLPFFIVLLRESTNGHHWVILFFFIVWSSDTGAYFVGKKYGQRKLYVFISPKKTREGAWGGMGAAIGVTLLYKLIFFKSMSWTAALVAPALVSAFSQVGDLAESFFKRAYNAKDSGTLLPGHGGFLDRFDGVLFGLPVMYACVRLFGG